MSSDSLESLDSTSSFSTDSNFEYTYRRYNKCTLNFVLSSILIIGAPISLIGLSAFSCYEIFQGRTFKNISNILKIFTAVGICITSAILIAIAMIFFIKNIKSLCHDIPPQASYRYQSPELEQTESSQEDFFPLDNDCARRNSEEAQKIHEINP